MGVAAEEYLRKAVKKESHKKGEKGVRRLHDVSLL